MKNLQNEKVVKSLKNACKLKIYYERGQDDQLNDEQANIPLHDKQQGQRPDQTQNDTSEQTQNENQNQRNITDQSDEEYLSALTDDIRTIDARKQGIKQWFKVLWPENTKKWILESYVNQEITKEYLKTYTFQGKKRKKHKKKFFARSSDT